MSAERDPLEDLLVREPYIDDAGFTERVMARLPGPRAGRRPAILGASGLVAAGLAVAYLPGALRDLVDAASAAAASRGRSAGVTPLPVSAVLTGISCLAALVAAGAILRRA
jgi:hypothetical protein